MSGGINDILLVTDKMRERNPLYEAHFRLREFANAEGVVMVHPALINGLEALRHELYCAFREEVWIIITDGIRTQDDLERLADKYGWIDEGGVVSRDSKHLTKYGGIAADIKCFKANKGPDGRRERVAQALVGRMARRFFLFVKDDYADGHVHVDCWDREKGGINV